MINEELNALFSKWIEAHKNESKDSLEITIGEFRFIGSDSFSYDGVIDEEAYMKAPLKVLFISSEPNIDEHSAKNGTVISDNRKSYLEYYNSGEDKWLGKMRERLSAIYMAITKQGKKNFHNFANQFAVMDINKRGGPAKVRKVGRLCYYATLYKNFLITEISIINPDIIVWIGFNTYRAGVPEILDAKSNGNAKWFDISGRKIPIVPMWQTSYYQSRINPLEGYDNKTVGKLCAKAVEEYEKAIASI